MPRQGWNRAAPAVLPELTQIEKMIAPVFRGRKIAQIWHAEGGLANTNIVITFVDDHPKVLLRIFQRDPRQALKEVRLNNLVFDTVPSPRFYHFAETNEITGQPYVVMEWIDAPRLETVVESLGNGDMLQIARSLGKTLSAIHSFKFEQFGALDETLSVNPPLDFGSEGLIAFAKECLLGKGGSARLGEDLSQEALEFLERESGIVDSNRSQPCLAHCDFGGSNILVKQSNEGWRVAAVLDWEFAWSGTPYMDLGNLLRKPLGAIPEFAQSLHDSYRAAGGVLASDWRRLSLMIDLSAWFDFMARKEASTELIADAQTSVRETMKAWK